MIIAVIAIIVVGPRDLPRMLRTLGQYTRKMRDMAGEFKSQFNDALDEAELGDLKKDVESLRSLDPLKDVKDELSPFKSLGDDLKNTMEAPASAETIAAPEQASVTPPKKPSTRKAGPKTKSPRKSSPRSAAQTNRAGPKSTKTAKSVTAKKKTPKKPAKSSTKPVATNSKKTAKPVKGQTA